MTKKTHKSKHIMIDRKNKQTKKKWFDKNN